MRRLSTLTSATLGLLLLFGFAAPGAQAIAVMESTGTLGKVYGWGATVCNPFRSSGFASRYIEIGSPLVSESDAVSDPNVSVIGGGQTMRWHPWLEKWVNGQWTVVWVGAWRAPSTYFQITGFEDPMVNVYNLSKHPGRGYFRSGGTLLWLADSEHQAGGVRYRHSAGNYFKDGYADQGGASATRLSTGYCWAG